jgi:hypothetical protein
MLSGGVVESGAALNALQYRLAPWKSWIRYIAERMD